ncbi:MAG: M1 family metallopeptidase [Bacteroidia bacterium]|nr:M1 family metallopeptidase [Bacteroidia bacterium]
MTKFYTCIVALLIFQLNSYGQAYNPLQKPNTYRNTDNPNYWKNRPPYPGYWQQDVYYDIKAKIDETTDIIEGRESLTYWNNSPDDLNFVFFHLYQNAFQPDSYLDELQKENKVKPRYGKYEREKKGTEILKLNVNGIACKIEYDNTIAKVWLPKTLKPGESITFDIDFKTYYDYGSTRRRMKAFNSFGQKHYDGVHWYPRISVYDSKFGWDTQQHLGKEFYGDFGAYDVELDFADNFVVEATGNLLNQEEVLPDELREKLDITNFKDKVWNSPPSVITPYDKNKRKVWKYHAENVHDFAFTADPTYRIDEYSLGKIKVIAVVQEPHASGWLNAAQYTGKVIKIFSRDFGMYAYPKMVVADARDGMEYPMLTLDGGRDPDYRQLLVHEVGHNWFFGMVGNNETYRAMLDEGFTQFLTAWGLTAIDGDTLVKANPKSKYVNKFMRDELAIDARVYNPYINDAIRGTSTPLNIHSDDFNGALGHGGGYRNVYFKTGTMLYNLQYVLGDSLFLAAMKHYFEQWKFCHPYVEDFRNSMIQFTKVDLNWFFDQWIETDKVIDYKIGKIKPDVKAGTDVYKITFKRLGEMQMPLDFDVISKNDSVYHFHIPNHWFVKKTEAQVLPRWVGWGKLKPKYEASVNIPGGINNIIIDPSNRLGDVNLLNNKTFDKTILDFDHRLNNPSDRHHYEFFLRPDFWYNRFDGAKIGAHINGNYLKYKNVFDFTVWFSSMIGQNIEDKNYNFSLKKFSYALNYTNPTNKIVKNSAWYLTSRWLDGLVYNIVGVEKKSETLNTRFYAYAKSMYRKDSTDLIYLMYKDLWQYDKWNNTANLGFDYQYRYFKGYGYINMNLKASTMWSDYDYSQISMTAINRSALGSFDVNTRVFAQFGTGSNTPLESQLYAAGANPEQLMDNKYTRADAFVPRSWSKYDVNTNHFQQGGGLNLRGFAGYLMPVNDINGVQQLNYRINSGASINAELGFDRLWKKGTSRIRGIIDYDLYLFADAGVLQLGNIKSYEVKNLLKADAGIGTAIYIKKFGPMQNIKPFCIRFDAPLFINTPPFTEPEFIKFRWVVGINKSF